MPGTNIKYCGLCGVEVEVSWAIYRCDVANRHLMTDVTTAKQLHVR